MNNLQVEDPIERNTQLSLDSQKALDALSKLDEGERVVLELGLGLNGGEAHSLDSIARKLGRTKHWAKARLDRGLMQLRQTMGVEIKAPMLAMSIESSVGDLQEECEVKTAILDRWKISEPNRKELGKLLSKLQEMLAIRGRKGQFTAWLEQNHISRATAYRYIADNKPEEQLVDSTDDKTSQLILFTPELTEKRFQKFKRTALKLYDCFSGNRNGDQILREWDAISARVRTEMLQTLGRES